MQYVNHQNVKFMQDGRMRGKCLYRFYLYDKLSRVVVEGTCTSCNRGKNVTRTTLDTRQSGFLGTGYVIGHDLRLENPKLEVVNYYDNYDYLNLPLAKSNHGLDWQQQITSGTNTTGLVTGTYSVSSDNSPLLDVFCYNAKGQVIQSYRVLSGNSFLKQNTKYTFTGKQENVSQLLFKNGRGYTTETVNSYNKHNDQLESTTLSVNGTQMKISALEYDDLGRIKSNAQGQTSTEYTYNLRGWTTDIVNPKFEEHLTYNDGSLGTPYFSGNISTQQWKTADDNILRGYKFTYDKLNRLTNSEYGEGISLSTNQGRYNEFIQGYTANGAITKILRNGLMQNGSYGAIDDLSITLNGNQLSSIEEKAAPVLRAGSFDFRKVSSPSDGQDEYMYDENGALIYDANRGITKIVYDLRNNPRLIQFSDGSQTEYVYSALGEKLKTIHRTATFNSSSFDGDDTVVDVKPTSNPFPMPRLLSSGEAALITDTATCQDMTATTILSIDSTEYIGNFIFENGHADKYLFPGGYYSFVSTSPLSSERTGEVSSFHYYLTDHLGNNRVVVNDNGDIEQTTHYYPFGAVYADAGKNPDFQKFKYTGEELDLVHGLNTYDHGARQNYSILGVWDKVDPMAEKYYNISPYAVCANNPTCFYDLNGEVIDTTGLFGNDLLSYNTMIEGLRNSSKLFDKLYQTLQSSEKVIKVEYVDNLSNEGNDIDGCFYPDSWTINFNRNSSDMPSSVPTEEFFHAFQQININYYQSKDFNREFEAKVFDICVGLEGDEGFGNIKGMDDFIHRIETFTYGDVFLPITVEKSISSDFLNDFKKSCIQWAKYNIRHNFGNEYYRSLITSSPYSLQSIIKYAYEKN